MKKNFKTIGILSLLAVCAACGGAKNKKVEAPWSQAESLSVEVSLDRIQDSKELQKQAKIFLNESSVSGQTPWVDLLANIAQSEIDSIAGALRSERPYNIKGSQLPPSKIFVEYNKVVLEKARDFKGDFDNFMSALAGLGFQEASKIKNKYEGVKANHANMAVLQGEIHGLTTMAESATPKSKRREAIDAQLEKQRLEFESQEERNLSAEEALFKEIEDLKKHGSVGKDLLPLARNLYRISRHIASMERESEASAQVAKLQLDQMLRAPETYLDAAAERIVDDVIYGPNPPPSATPETSIKVNIDGDILSFDIANLSDTDTFSVKKFLTEEIMSVKDSLLKSNSTACSEEYIADFDYVFFKAMAQALAALSGETYNDDLGFKVPNTPPSPMKKVIAVKTETEQPPVEIAESLPPNGPFVPSSDAAPSEEKPETCPSAMCKGPISGDALGAISVGMSGQEVADALHRTIETEEIDENGIVKAVFKGVVIRFRNGGVSGFEISSKSSQTNEGLGVGSEFSVVGKKYGRSKCIPIENNRFAVEFEKIQGVLWVSNRQGCEGIEDLDFWDRPCKGKVTRIYISATAD